MAHVDYVRLRTFALARCRSASASSRSRGISRKKGKGEENKRKREKKKINRNDNRASWGGFLGRAGCGEIVERDAVYSRDEDLTGEWDEPGEPELFLSQIKHSGNKVSAHRERPKRPNGRNLLATETRLCSSARTRYIRTRERTRGAHAPQSRTSLALKGF